MRRIGVNSLHESPLVSRYGERGFKRVSEGCWNAKEVESRPDYGGSFPRSGSVAARIQALYSQGSSPLLHLRRKRTMVDTNDGEAAESRPPSLTDLLELCRNLNNAGANYIVIGGMAMVQAGFVRATEVIDLLIDSSAGNLESVRRALMQLPDQAVRELAADDVDRYSVVRVADEFVVDLMKSACGIAYEDAKESINFVTIEGVRIPFASPELLWRLKQTRREKDKLDLLFLTELLKNR